MKTEDEIDLAGPYGDGWRVGTLDKCNGKPMRIFFPDDHDEIPELYKDGYKDAYQSNQIRIFGVDASILLANMNDFAGEYFDVYGGQPGGAHNVFLDHDLPLEPELRRLGQAMIDAEKAFIARFNEVAKVLGGDKLNA